MGLVLLLGGVMAAFGGLLYLRVRDSMLKSVDSELSAQAQAVAASIRPVLDDRFELALPEPQVRYFQTTGYLVVRNPRGEIVDFTDPAMADLDPFKTGVRQRGEYREVAASGPGGSFILVGRPIRDQLAQLRELLGVIVGIGAVVFAVGLLGGWILIGRILNPIQRMARTAASISESNPSSRIDVTATENELEDLARTLNSAFDRLEAAMKRQGQFTADASHELRTPLSVLMTQLELGLKKDRSPAEYRAVLETCLKAVQRMASLAEGLLFLSRADAKAVELRREPLDLKEIVEESVGLVRPLAENRGIRLSVGAESQRLVGDRTRLGEAVTNLVTNAIQYNRPDGRVEVTLKDGVLEISDTGPGIPEEDRPHVFERFYRADKARSRNVGGAGLGLAITKSIVEAHGGTIEFESRNGNGTVFRVRIPARQGGHPVL